MYRTTAELCSSPLEHGPNQLELERQMQTCGFICAKLQVASYVITDHAGLAL